VRQEVVLAMVTKGPADGCQLRSRLRQTLGPLGEEMNAGQISATLARLEKAGLVACDQAAGPDSPERKVYVLTPVGNQRVSSRLAEASWPKTRPGRAPSHICCCRGGADG
jgi:DNA-binding PadR family transcriptional regulator